ncbi:hypothetical protein C8R45DRAFT_161952 [Mycena sanguinolenta]|nr:hypothetical protein C8R45DRAFT_161952 [Mycena sanguinolenta]
MVLSFIHDVPPELIENIVGLLDDSDSLKALSLVCTALVPFAQRILLRFLTIQQIGSGRWRTGQRPSGVLSIQSAHASLQASPHISSYIRYLKILFTGPPLNATEEGALEFVLSVLNNVEALAISGAAGGPHSPLASSLLPRFLAVLQLSSIERVYLLNTPAIPSPFLSVALVSARVVFMQNIGLVPELTPKQDFVGVGVGADRPRLEHLICRGSLAQTSMYSVLDFIVASDAPHYLRNVRTLELTMPPGSQAPARGIMAAVAATVETLRIDYGDCYRSRPDGGLQLPVLPALRSIELTLFLGWVRRLPPDIYSTVTAFAEALPNIQRIRLVFILDSLEQHVPWQDSNVFALFDKKREWRARLPRLRRLECRLSLLDSSNPQIVRDDGFAEFVSNMTARFPGLDGTDILSFSRVMTHEEP